MANNYNNKKNYSKNKTYKKNNYNKNKKQNLTEEEKQAWLNMAANSFVGEKFTPETKSYNKNGLTKNNISQYMSSPYASYQSLQDMSELFMINSGIYYRLIKLLSSLLTYDHYLIPKVDGVTLDKYLKDVPQSYATASLYLDKLNVKSNCITFAEDLLTRGECYYFRIEDDTGIVYQRVANKYCRPYYEENGVWKFVLDMGAISSSNDVTIYPTEIQKAIELYKKDSKNKKFIANKYYEVVDGVCFSIIKDANHGFPPLLFMFDDLLSLEDKKDLKDKIDLVNNVKMIHNKVIADSDGAMLDVDIVNKFNNAIKRNLEERGLSDLIFSISNPFEAQTLNLTQSNTNIDNLLSKSIQGIYSEAGTPELLFSSGESAEALKRSCITLGAYCVNMFLKKFESYYNYELSNYNTTKVPISVKFLETTRYDKLEFKSSCETSLAYGGSRAMYNASCGLTPIEAVNIYKMEQALGMDDLMISKDSSYTKSGNSDTKDTVSDKIAKGETIGDTSEATSPDNK